MAGAGEVDDVLESEVAFSALDLTEVGPVDEYLVILDDVRSGRMPAEPILLADPGLERLVILEGHLRITAYLVDPTAVPFPIRALVGVSPNISEWSEW